jgi:CheY-like chemotaxis protein
MNVLVVEDYDSTTEVIADTIEAWDHEVEISATGEDALEKVRKKQFDLVLLDLFLPDCKGNELISQLREIWPDIGIVAMTGYNSRELELQVRQQRVLYYMIKPFETQTLKELLDHLSLYLKKRDRQVNG